MLETLRNYGIFFLIIILIVIASSLVKRFALLSTLFKFLGKALFIILNVLMIVFFTLMFSLGAGIIIFIHPYLHSEPQFFANGEAVHFLTEQDYGLLRFSLTYGILYMIVFLINSRFLVKTRIAGFFKSFARILRFYSRNRRNKRDFEKRVVGTASHFMTLTIVFFLYPLVITALFPELEMTPKGNLTLLIALILFSLVPDPKYRGQTEQTRYYNVG